MGLHPAILDKMAADRFPRLQQVRDKAEMLERHIQHMREKTRMNHTTLREDQPGKKKRKDWTRGQGAEEAGQSATPHLGGAVQSYPTPPPPTPRAPPAPAVGNGGCFNCGTPGHFKRNCPYRGGATAFES